MKNIDAFNLAAAGILGKLYGEFPRPVTINVDGLREEIALPAEVWWEAGTDNLLAATLRWLEAEGFVRYTGETGGRRFANVVLTARGLAALNRTPDSLASAPTIGERLKTLACAMAPEVATALIRGALNFGG